MPMAVLSEPLVVELPDGPTKKLSVAAVGIADAGQLRRIEIGQPAAIAVDDARDERLALAAADADDVVVASNALVADVNVGTAGG